MNNRKYLESLTLKELRAFVKSNPIFAGSSSKKRKADLISFILIRQRKYSIGNRKLLFGDFDKDGLKNIDDLQPFKKSSKTVEETKLSDAVLNAESHHKSLKPTQQRVFKKFQNIVQRKGKYPSSALSTRTASRVKTPISMMNKLVSKKMYCLNDRIGMMYIGKDYNDLKQMQINLEKEFIVQQVDDAYIKTRPDGYKAIHLEVCDKISETIMEIQLKTKRIKRIADLNHTLYKMGKTNKNNFKQMVALAEMADNQIKPAQQLFKSYSNKEILSILTSEKNIPSFTIPRINDILYQRKLKK